MVRESFDGNVVTNGIHEAIFIPRFVDGFIGHSDPTIRHENAQQSAHKVDEPNYESVPEKNRI